MAQLLQYGMNMGIEGRHFTAEDLQAEGLRLIKELRIVSDVESGKGGS